MSHLRRLAAVLLLAVLSCVGTAGPAAAHVELVWSFPTPGASLPHPPAEVALESSGALDLEVSQIVVRDALGQVQELEGPRLAKKGLVLVGALPTGGAWGQWQVDYRLVGVDGHAVTGRIDFAVGEAAATAAEQTGRGLAPWLVLGGAVSVLAAAWFLRRSTARAISGAARAA